MVVEMECLSLVYGCKNIIPIQRCEEGREFNKLFIV